jgi:hypothetical protein
VIILREHSFLLPKEGSSALECEDAIARNSRTRRFAVGDGATEAFDSRRWARYLTYAWVNAQQIDLSRELFVSVLKRMGEQFTRRIDVTVLPWYAAEKAASGSFAAFIGLEIAPDGIWKAVALGDCCLFHERGNHMIKAFPITTSECFGSRPALIPSQPGAVDDAAQNLKTCIGQLEQGDSIWLMSDAIACWYLIQCEEETNSPAFEALGSAIHGGYAEIAALVECERRARRLRNDDVALLYIEALPSSP